MAIKSVDIGPESEGKPKRSKQADAPPPERERERERNAERPGASPLAARHASVADNRAQD